MVWQRSLVEQWPWHISLYLYWKQISCVSLFFFPFFSVALIFAYLVYSYGKNENARQKRKDPSVFANDE